MKGDCSLYPLLYLLTFKPVDIVLLQILNFYLKTATRTGKEHWQTKAWMLLLRQAAALRLYSLSEWGDACLILSDLPVLQEKLEIIVCFGNVEFTKFKMLAQKNHA